MSNHWISRERSSESTALALVLGLLGVIALRADLFSSGFDRIPGDEGDARSFVYLAEHWYQFFRGHADLFSPGMFYPVQGTLGYTDPIPAHAIPFAVLRVTGLDMFTALAATVVLFDLLNYVACFFLLNRVLRLNAIASVVGAMFFAFNSPRFSHAGHFNLLAAFFLPLAIAFVVHFVRDSRLSSQWKAFSLLSAATLCFDLQLVTSLYQAWFFALWVLILLALTLAVRPSRRFVLGIIERFWPAMTGAAAVLVIGLSPMLSIYLPAARVVGPRSYGLVQNLIPEGWSLLQMGSGNYVWGDVSEALSRVHPLPSTEHNIGIGLIATLAWLTLTVWGVITVRRRVTVRGSDRETPDAALLLSLMILATTLFYAIGMKYWNGSSPWRLVYLFVPGANGLRGVARYVMFLALPMAITFAVAIHRGMQRISAHQDPRVRRSLVTAMFAVLAFGVFEQFGRAPSISRTAELARLNRVAAKLPLDCASFYVAADPDRRPVKYEYQIDAMLISVIQHVPTLNGYSGNVPPGWSLRDVEAPDYEERVAKWIATHKLTAPVCRLEIGD